MTRTGRPGGAVASAAAARGAAARPKGSAPRRGRLADVRIGTVPILWNNADLPEISPFVPADVVLDEIARLGYAGTQTGVGFPTGAALREALRSRNLALAEVYAAIPASIDGPDPDAADVLGTALDTLDAGDGDVLIAALALSAGRAERAGRATEPGTPRLTDDGWRRLADLLHGAAQSALARGRRLAFHPHAGTYVETPDEVERLAGETDAGLVGVCLDVGHYLVGGGDPSAAVGRFAERITHVHLKDVAPEPLAGLRGGAVVGFLEALRARIFVELGAGVVDLDAILDALADRGYAGWLMLEQDTTWRPPSESAAISRRVLDYAIRRLDDIG